MHWPVAPARSTIRLSWTRGKLCLGEGGWELHFLCKVVRVLAAPGMPLTPGTIYLSRENRRPTDLDTLLCLTNESITEMSGLCLIKLKRRLYLCSQVCVKTSQYEMFIDYQPWIRVKVKDLGDL